LVCIRSALAFCSTGLSIGVRRAVRRQIDSLVVPVPADQRPRSTASRDEPKSVSRSAVDQLNREDRDLDGQFGADVPPAPPRMHARTPPPPPISHTREGYKAPRLAPGENSALFTSSLLAGQGSSYDSEASATIAADADDVLVVSLDDPALGAGVQPPLITKTFRGELEKPLAPNPLVAGGEEATAPSPSSLSIVDARGDEDDNVKQGEENRDRMTEVENMGDAENGKKTVKRAKEGKHDKVKDGTDGEKKKKKKKKKEEET